MKQVVIYSKPVCPYCDRAKALLGRQGMVWTEIDVSRDEAARAEMLAKSGGRMTVPQIFIDGVHIGGYDDLRAYFGAPSGA